MTELKKRWGLCGLGRAVAGICALSVVSVACVGASADATGQPALDRGDILVVTTTYPLQYFAERIGGSAVEVVNLVSPGVEAHDFEPRPADIRLLDRADLVLYNGLGFEPWMGRALSNVSDRPRVIVEASKGAANDDPHVWLDPLKAAQQVKLIRDALIGADASMSESFAQAGVALIEELQALNNRYADGLASCELTSFVTSHDAFGHLALRYGLDQIPVSGLSPESEPSAGELARLADEILEMGARYLLVEPGGSTRLLQTLASETGAQLLILHPLASLTKAEVQRGEDYFSIMGTNLTTLRTVLQCN
ncbi:MAG: zinc ABC transporter substrate-binding protein [Chloroflexi bacterium]|nr:zinc ABC transporter substrate-binding protein [Chloroflexota bacterium]